MLASRGDRKPCTELACTGTMQFGREPQSMDASGQTVESNWAWLCNSDAGHIRRDADHSAPAPATDHHAGIGVWDDDGAPPAGAGARSPVAVSARPRKS